MEKVLRGDEKIRKAEEIYYRRKMGLPNVSKPYNEEKKSYIGSKIAFELLVILNLSLIIVAVQNKDFLFTSEFLNMLSDYNINLTKSVKSLIGDDENTSVTNEILNESNTENITSSEEAKQEPPNQELNNSGDLKQNVSSSEPDIVPNEEQVSSLSQMDLDVEEIKKSCSFQKPIEGTVTSLFGSRESVYQNVTGYHTGIDIGAEKGTSIKASNEGTVVLVSSKGDYGKHLKIENGKTQTLYAHCSKILVKEGDYVSSGQEIAKVRKYRKLYWPSFTL